MKTRKAKVLLVSLHDRHTFWDDGIVEAFGDEHDLRFHDQSKPAAEQFEGVDVVLDIGGWGSNELIDAAAEAKVTLWQVIGTGVDHLDLAYLKSKGIKAANCRGQTTAVGLAELAMMFMMMLSHKFNECTTNLHNKVLGLPFGQVLAEQTLGIVGFGCSGQELAIRAKAFGMRVEVIDVAPIAPEVLEKIGPDFVGGADDLDEVIARVDMISLHVPLIAPTHHLIDARRLALMKPTACLINVARGALVDEDALHKALHEGKLGGAGIDVFVNEPPDPTLNVYKLDNVVITPHVAGDTDDAIRKRAGVALENTNRVAEGLEPLYGV